MQQLELPEGYHTVMPYLIIPNPNQFLKFAIDVFGAKEKMVTNDDKGDIMHAEIYIGDSTLMFAGASDRFSAQPAGMFICMDDADATYQKALEAGASSIMPPADQAYGRSCGVADAFGNTWWITTVKNM